MTRPPVVSRDRALRHRVAVAIRHAFDDEAGSAALHQMADAGDAPPRALDVVAARARCGLAAVTAYRCAVETGTTPLARVLVQSGCLFEAGLFFEVHEHLEDAWRTLRDPERAFVQGLIQIAVGMHHLAHGNARGARSLFARGRARLAPYGLRCQGVELEALLTGLGDWEAAAGAGRWPDGLAIPPFVVRPADEVEAR